MESQKIKNILDHKENTYLKYQTKKWYIINDQNNGQYDYSDAYILVTSDITAVGGCDDTKIAFKNCHPFTKGKINLNDTHVDESDNLDLIMNMYNLIEYSDNYSDSTASLYHFKRQEHLANDANLDDKYKYKFK